MCGIGQGRSNISSAWISRARQVQSKVDVIFTTSYRAALATKTGTTLPVVVFNAGDPVATGLVNSLARSGGHLTGISDLAAELAPKRL